MESPNTWGLQNIYRHKKDSMNTGSQDTKSFWRSNVAPFSFNIFRYSWKRATSCRPSMSTLTTFLISASAMICTRPPSCCNGPAKLVGNDTCRWMTCVASSTSNGFVAVNKAVAAAAPWHWRRCAELPGLMPVAIECPKNQSRFSCENSNISTSTFESWGTLQNTCFGRDIEEGSRIPNISREWMLGNICETLHQTLEVKLASQRLLPWNPRVPPSMARLTSWNHHLVYESSNQFQWKYNTVHPLYILFIPTFVPALELSESDSTKVTGP